MKQGMFYFHCCTRRTKKKTATVINLNAQSTAKQNQEFLSNSLTSTGQVKYSNLHMKYTA